MWILRAWHIWQKTNVTAYNWHVKCENTTKTRLLHAQNRNISLVWKTTFGDLLCILRTTSYKKKELEGGTRIINLFVIMDQAKKYPKRCMWFENQGYLSSDWVYRLTWGKWIFWVQPQPKKMDEKRIFVLETYSFEDHKHLDIVLSFSKKKLRKERMNIIFLSNDCCFNINTGFISISNYYFKRQYQNLWTS